VVVGSGGVVVVGGAVVVVLGRGRVVVVVVRSGRDATSSSLPAQEATTSATAMEAIRARRTGTRYGGWSATPARRLSLSVACAA
jgi:hypothetical protein